METQKYVRKPFYVDAVRVTKSNMREVAQWCNGRIRTVDDQKFIKVRVYGARDERQSQAFVGDWVLIAPNGYKVYRPAAFDKTFDLTVSEKGLALKKLVDAMTSSPVPSAEDALTFLDDFDVDRTKEIALVHIHDPGPCEWPCPRFRLKDEREIVRMALSSIPETIEHSGHIHAAHDFCGVDCPANPGDMEGGNT